jgi:hypothetical protein
MAARKLDQGYVENLWSMFKTIDEKHVVSPEDAKKMTATGLSIGQEDAQLALRIYSKAAKSCKSADDFGKILENNEFPPIKLTQKEMEFVKGGRLARLSSAGVASKAAASSGASSGSCHGESTSSGRSSGSCHGESA